MIEKIFLQEHKKKWMPYRIVAIAKLFGFVGYDGDEIIDNWDNGVKYIFGRWKFLSDFCFCERDVVRVFYEHDNCVYGFRGRYFFEKC